MPRSQKLLIIIAFVIVAGYFFISFVLPPIVRSQLVKQVGQVTGRLCSVEKVSISPFNWSVKVSGVRLAERDARATFVSFSSLGFRVSPTSIYRMAPVVNDITLRSPYLHLVRTGPNSYNFSDILDRQPKAEKGSTARFSLNNIVLNGGRVEFEDMALAKPTRHDISEISVQVPFISNITYLADKYVDPNLSALVNGAPFRFGGKLRPFAKGMEATVKLDLKNLDIPFYAAYFPREMPLRFASGRLSTDLEISHRLVSGGKPDIGISGITRLQGVSMTDRGGSPLFSFDALSVDLAGAELLTRDIKVSSLLLDSPLISLARDRKGVWNFDSLLTRGEVDKEKAEPDAAAADEGKPKFIVKNLAIKGGKIRFRDALPGEGFATDLQGVELKAENLANYGDTPASWSLALATAGGEKAGAEGGLTLAPLSATAKITLSGLDLEAVYPYLSEMLTSPVKGRADFNTDLAYSSDKGLSLDRGGLTLKGVQIPFGPTDFVRLPLVRAEGGSLRLNDRSAGVEKITVSGGRIELSRDAGGKVSTALLLRPAVPGAKPQQKEKTAPPFRWRLGRLAISGVDAAFTDNMKEESPRLSLERIRVDASSIAGPAIGEFPIGASASYGEGELSVRGRLLPDPLKFKGDLVVKSLPLLDFEPYLPEGVNVMLLDGKLSTRLALNLGKKGDVLGGSFSGEAGVRDFHILDKEEEEDLLKWESLQLDGISGTLSPFSLTMSGVTLDNYYARVIINSAGRINLQDLYTPPAAKETPAPAVGQAAAVPAAETPPAQKSIRIGSITLQGGELNFADHHLNREFATTMLNLGGRVTGLSSDASTTADIDLRGNLENHSPLKIVGKINPLRGDLFLDMAIKFSEIELSPMTPYSGTYLGYAIDKGKLSLSLDYKIDQKKLSAENKVFLDQFTFGEKIESEKATSLPVRLAVALLKDRNGEIHLDLPLSGRTDDPKFSIWGVIGQILKNLLVKAATSPFALLQSAFGSSEDFSGVAFAPGTSRLSPAEESKLRTLAKVLADRPGIKLEVAGFADRERDPEGYRSEQLLKKMKSEKFLAMVKEKRGSTGLTAEGMEIPPGEQTRWLRAVYEKEKFPRPRTVIGTLKDLPDAEMRKLILANTVVGDQQLRQLARERVTAVTGFLVNEGKLPQERLFEKSGDVFAPQKKEGVTGPRVEFGVVD